MKIKSILPILTACVLLLSVTGCQKKQETDETPTEEPTPTEESLPENEGFDAVSYTSAYLDSFYKGAAAPLAELSGQPEADLTVFYENNIQELVTASIGTNENAPGTQVNPPQLTQDYTDLWKEILKNTRYTVTKAEASGESYLVTVESEKMELYTKMSELLPSKIDELYAHTDMEDIEQAYKEMMLTAYQEALSQVSYADAESISVTLSPAGGDIWTISVEDLDKLQRQLLDLDVAESGLLNTDPSQLQTEATPSREYPKGLEDQPEYQLGETVTLQQDGKDVATFCINSVAITDERNEYDTSNPEKVVVVNYTYQNLDYEDPLLYDQMSFQVLENDTVCTPYYLFTLQPADIALKGGDPITGSLAYSVSADCQEVVVYVNGVQILSPFWVRASLDN